MGNDNRQTSQNSDPATVAKPKNRLLRFVVVFVVGLVVMSLSSGLFRNSDMINKVAAQIVPAGAVEKK